ncbi:tandem-95 repeat protein [Vibrio chaetopteri]|uniref:tandem-95 repeat protein n=1 Tax=Vibrio chaetopteri TaxID=3016528 RepID=UPI003AB400AB
MKNHKNERDDNVIKTSKIAKKVLVPAALMLGGLNGCAVSSHRSSAKRNLTSSKQRPQNVWIQSTEANPDSTTVFNAFGGANAKPGQLNNSSSSDAKHGIGQFINDIKQSRRALNKMTRSERVVGDVSLSKQSSEVMPGSMVVVGKATGVSLAAGSCGGSSKAFCSTTTVGGEICEWSGPDSATGTQYCNPPSSDTTPPVVNSITPKNSPSPSAASIQFSVIFDESANDVSIDDFILTSTDSASGSINAVSSSSGSAIDVTVNSMSGQGTLRLDLKGSANITDDDGNGNGTNGYVDAYTGGTAHTVDRIAPDVSTIIRKTPSVADTNSDTLVWTVSFSKSVSNITTNDFEVSGTTASVTSVSAASGSSVDVTVSGGNLADYSGGVSLSIAAGNNLQDSSGNSLSSSAPTSAESYSLDNDAPLFTSVSDSSDSNYKAGETVTITVDLGETGLNVTANLSVLDSDFSTTQALTDNNDDTYSFQTPALDAGGNMQEGTFAITVTATDAVGNENTDNSLSLTLDKTPPTFSSADSVPTDNAFGIAPDSNLVLDFSENVELVSGKTFAIYDVTNGAVLETYTASSTMAATGSSSGSATLSGDTLTISPSSGFSLGNRYAVTIDSTTLQDPSGNVFAGISDYITYNFAVKPELKLTVADSNIAENSGSTTYTVALIDGNGNAYSADENITVEMVLSGTAVSASDYSVSGLDGSNQITIATGDATNTFTVTSNSDASDDDGETIIIGMNSVVSGAATIGSVASQTVTINQNDQAVIAGLDATPTFSEGGSAVIIDDDVTVSDTELDALNSAQGNYDGSSITIVRAGGAQSGDVFGGSGSLGALVESGNVTYNGTVVGTVTTNSAGTLTLTFSSNATTALVNSVLQNITYENTSDDPANTVSLSFVFNDGIENSSAVQVTASITAVNDVPTLSATGSSPTFVEGGAAAVLFSSAAVSTVEASQTLAGLVITVTNVADATNEKLTIDGTSITLTAGQSGSTSNFSYAVSVVSTTATVTLTGGTLTEAQMQSVIDAISYQNDSDDPTTASSRVVTIASISETGSDNTVANTTISSTVSVNGVDDEPIVSANGLSPTYTEGAATSYVYSSASVDTVESSQTITGATFSISGVQDGSEEALVVDATEITLVQGTSGTTPTNLIDYSVSVSGNVATVVLSNVTGTTQLAQQLLNYIGYIHKGQDPIEGNRVVTLTEVTDSGLNSGDNDDLNDTLTIASTVSVSAVDDAPTLSASGLNQTFTENGSSVSIFSSAAVDTVEASQLIESITWQASGATNSGGEYLVVDGTDVSLVDGVSGTSSANSFAYQVSVVSSGVFSVSVSKQDTASNYQTLIDGIAYKNTAENIVTGSRTISITNLVDSGGSDGSNLNSNSSLSLTSTLPIVGVNDDPSITIGNQLSTDEDNNQTLSFNFSDVDGDTVTATEKSAPSHGQIAISGTDIVYTPTANYNGSDSFTITLTDGNGYTVDKTINVTVSSVNDEPSITIASTLTTDEDNNQTLSFNFSDVDGDTVTATEKSAPSHGQIAISGTDIVYTPTGNYNGSDSFTITLTDGNGYTVDKTINVTVSSVNDEPSITIASTLTTDEDNNQTLSFNFSDVDGDTVTATEKSAPSHGQIAISGTDIVYTPTGNYNGSDSFTITLTDGNGYTVDKTINVTVFSVNDEPSITITSTLTTDEDNNQTLSFNFSDVDGDTVTATEKSAPSHGQIAISGTDIVYTPTANYNGSDSFTITLTDGNGYTVDKTINVTVSSVNDEPSITIASTLTTDEDNNQTLSFNFSDVDGDTVTATEKSAPSHGEVAISGTDIVYTPTANYNGSDSFTITLTDGNGYTVDKTINVTVSSVNDEPSITIASTLTTDEDNNKTLSFNFSDVDGDTVTATEKSAPSHGEIAISGTDIVYTPTANYNGSDSFTITLTDESGYTVDRTINVQVISVNDDPVVTGETLTFAATAQGLYSFAPLANDMDPDDDTLTLAWARADTGTLTVNGDSIELQTADVGVVTIKYGVKDSNDAEVIGEAVLEIVASDGPTVTAPDDVEINASALFTKVDLGVATAIDSSGQPLPVVIENSDGFFTPGVHKVSWAATDQSGNTGKSLQTITVHPLISIEKDGKTVEDTEHQVAVYLNGKPSSYPVVIPYTAGGTMDTQDHNLVSGEVVITSGLEGVIDFEIFSDDVADSEETLIITLSDTVNLGSKHQYVLTVYEVNVAPDVALQVIQNDEPRTVISPQQGTVTITAVVDDVNPGDSHQYRWINDNSALANISQAESVFEFDPSALTDGVYELAIEVTDSGNETVNTSVFLEVIAELATLGEQDTDGDLIPDNQEGYSDSDGDGIPDFQDAITECNVIQSYASESGSFLVEGEPGVCLRKGVTIADGMTGGALLLEQELPVDEDATNVGGVFDYVAIGLPIPGQSYSLVLPQSRPIPLNAVYRKYSEANGWVTLANDGTDPDNYVSSAPGFEGYCPPPGDSSWQQGQLIEGHWCVQLTIKDGGIYDDDGEANGRIVDPGGVATTSSNTLPQAESDEATVVKGGTVTINVLANDNDGDGDALQVTSASSQLGSVSIENNQLVYQAPADFFGVDTLSYGISDGNGGTAFSNVSVNVNLASNDVVRNSSSGGSIGGWLVMILAVFGAIRAGKVRVSTVLLGLLTAFNVNADWFLKADIGQARADERNYDNNPQVLSVEDRDTAWLLGVGYRYNQDWAVSVNYINLGKGSAELEADVGQSPEDYHRTVAKVTPALGHGIGLDVDYTLWENDKVSLNGIAGALAWRTEFESEYQGQKIESTEDGIDPYIAFALKGKLSSNIMIGAKVSRYFIRLNDVTTYSAVVEYQFGNQ